jgi:23S rRNA maturation mini-RNase III
MLVSFELTERERSILSRGRNAGSPSGGRRSRGPKRLYKSQTNGGQGPGAYQDSTALEALIGYSYLTDQGRCGEVLNFLSQELDVMDDDDGVIR